MANSNGFAEAQDTLRDAPEHPYLSQPFLYITGLDPQIDDRELASEVFSHCLPVRLNIDRNTPAGQLASGTVEFQSMEKTELALATVRNVSLRIRPVTHREPEPAAKPRLVKGLPPLTDDTAVYNLFRPFGAIARVQCIETNLQGHYTGFKGMANVVYYNEADAIKGQNQLHCLEISGKLISVAPDTSRRPSVGDAPGVGSKLSARAPSFVPTASSAPGQEFAPLSGSIDPCNLFCKNLCPSIDNSELFSLFKSFGHITSARVMRDDQGKSREFGFVSYSTPESATAAMRALDGQQVGTKAITIRVHEPKQVREQKLARIFSGSSSAGSAGGASSRGPSVSPSMSPRSPVSPSNSNSNKGYFTSIPMGNEQLSASTTATSVGAGAFDEIELSRMEPTERDDIIMTEFIKRARELPGRNDDDDVRTIVKGLVGLSLSEQIGALNDSKAFERHVREIKREEEQKEPAAADTPKPAAVDLPAEKKQAPVAAAATEGPAAQVNGASTVEPLPTPQTEKERLVQAVVKLMPTASPSSVEDIVELLVGLPKKERAMALFNGDYLKTKVDAAQAILQMNDDEDIGAAKSELAKEGASTDRVTAAAATKPAEPTASATSPAGGPTHTLASLARLPCLEIVSLARASPTSLPVAPVDQAVWSSTDAMMDRILSESREAERKQKLGDVLFKKIKGLGFKGAPKITIKLLDGEDLRSLAHVAESFPEVLREKVGVVQEELGLKK